MKISAITAFSSFLKQQNVKQNNLNFTSKLIKDVFENSSEDKKSDGEKKQKIELVRLAKQERIINKNIVKMLKQSIKERQKLLKIYERKLNYINWQYCMQYDKDYENYIAKNPNIACSNLPDAEMSEDLIAIVEDSRYINAEINEIAAEISQLQAQIEELEEQI